MERYYSSKKEEADSLKKIQIWWLRKHDYLSGSWRFGGIKWANKWSGKETSVGFEISLVGDNNYIQLKYAKTDQNGEDIDFNYLVLLTTTSCYFGGKRYWFICPLFIKDKYCGRRVGVLYLAGSYFGCRHCYNLTYASRNENRRFKDYSTLYLIGNIRKKAELEERIKHKTYGGKPTRKQRALNKLYFKEFPYAIKFMENEKNKGIDKKIK
ncbi:hypothetical protein C4559_06470 [Candidatus Microgenomates bacterium]|nr:MAG: hypothetical protein C4559_06470 [Candidatus Microgenomates bacterium]